MRAMILAAGRGQRMGELTATTPKPLLKAGGRFLIDYVIEQLVTAGITDIVINVSYLGEQIKRALGNGSRYGVHIEYSLEETRLETGGGILKALNLLGDNPFLVLSSDVLTDYPLIQLPTEPKEMAHIVCVPNPQFHPEGDFGLNNGYVDLDSEPKVTYANVGVFRPELFAPCKPGYFPLNEVLLPAICHQRVTGELYHGQWQNIGTKAQLDAFASSLASEVGE